MSDNKHHYVTKAYLESMLFPGESRLWVYERNQSRVFRNIPKNLASIRGYYSITRCDGTEDDKFEEFLDREIERPGIHVFRQLSSGFKQLKWDDFASGATLIAMQELRVPFIREQLEASLKGIIEQYMNFMFSIPGYLERTLSRFQDRGETITANDLRKLIRSGHLKLEINPEGSLMALSEMFPILMQAYSVMKWTVLISEDKVFMISDSPVCRHYPQTERFGAGLINPDLEVYFPIAYDRMLVLQHDLKKVHKLTDLGKKGRIREARKLAECTPEIRYKKIDEKEADQINQLIIERAHRWIYAPSEIPSIHKFFVGESKNMRIQVKSTEGSGPLLIQLKHEIR
jgi:hypothetical protein